MFNKQCDLNACDENGQTALHLAVKDNYSAAISLLNNPSVQIDVS